MGLHEGVIYIQQHDPNQPHQIIVQQQPVVSEHGQVLQQQIVVQHTGDPQQPQQIYYQEAPPEEILSTVVEEAVLEQEQQHLQQQQETAVLTTEDIAPKPKKEAIVYEKVNCSICSEEWTKSNRRRKSNIRLRDFKSCIEKNLGNGAWNDVCPKCTEVVDQVYTLQSLLRAKIRELKERHKKIAEHVEESETRSLKKLGMDNKEEVDAFLAKYDTLEAVDVMHHLNNFSQMLDSYDEAPRKRVKREPGRGRKPATKKKGAKKPKKEEEEDPDFDPVKRQPVESDNDMMDNDMDPPSPPATLDKEDLLNVLTSASTPLKEFMEKKKKEKLKKDKKLRDENKVVKPKKERAPRKKKERKSEQCELCGKVLSRACDMVAHMNMHRGIKPHMCVHCGKCFAKRENMYTHVSAVHQKVRSYACTLCEKKFARKWLLEGHIGAKHNGIRPYRCEHCAATFSYRTGIRKHKKASCPVLSALPGWVKPPPQKNYKKNKSAGGARKNQGSDSDSDDGSRSGVAVKQELVPVEIEIENAVYSINNINQSINHIM